MIGKRGADPRFPSCRDEDTAGRMTGLDIAAVMHRMRPQRSVRRVLKTALELASFSTISTARAKDSIGISSFPGKFARWCADSNACQGTPASLTSRFMMHRSIFAAYLSCAAHTCALEML
jgi:hypothetical protein